MKNELLYKNKYGISTARLPDWDYSDTGMYFITICTLNRERHFGNITNGIVALNECGRYAKTIWRSIPWKYKHTRVDEYCIMPNHISWNHRNMP